MSAAPRTQVEPPDLLERRLERPPPRIGIGEAVMRHWFVALLPVLLLVGAALGLSASREKTYSATARLAVGDPDLSAPGALAGLTQAKQALASSYSRLVTATAVLQSVVDEVKLDRADVAAKVSGSPIPDSPIVRVQATGDSAGDAMRLANATGRALAEYSEQLNDKSSRARRIFRRYKDAGLLYSRQQSREAELREAFNENPTASNRLRLADAQARADASRMRLHTLRTLYVSTEQSQAAGIKLEVIDFASSATSDARTKREALLFGGLVGGVVLGAGLALLRARRVARRE